jgi:hypothetical protein
MAWEVASQFDTPDGSSGHLALFDLTGAPDVPIANSIIFAALGGAPAPILLRSGLITKDQLPAPFTLRDLAVKGFDSGSVFFNIRFIRVD